MTVWQSSDAKAKFAEVIRRANAEGPQIITHRGAEAVVVLSMDDYLKLQDGRPDLKDWLLSGPKSDEFADILDEIVANRSRADRPIDLS